MAFYYVKSGGTATGDAGRATTQRTGTFAAMGASAYYASISAAISATTSPADGDFICCSSAHAFTQAGSITITPTASLTIVSVDDSNADQELAGASEESTSADIVLNYGTRVVIMVGISLFSEDDIDLVATNSTTLLDGCSIGPEGGASTGDVIGTLADGQCMRMLNTTVFSADVANARLLSPSNGIRIDWIGGSIGARTNKPEFLVSYTGNGGSNVVIDGVDLSGMNSGFSVVNATGATADDANFTQLNNCELPATWSLGERPLTGSSRIELINCSSSDKNTSAYMDFFGDSITEETIVRTDGAVIEGQAVAFAVNTTANAVESVAPFKFKLATLRADFSTAKTLDVHVVHDSVGSGTGSHTQDDELWIEVLEPDATGGGMIFNTSRPADLFSPSDNATSTEAWTTTGITSPVKDKLTITTAGTGGTGWAEVFLCQGKPSVEVFACPKVEAS